MIWEGSGAGSGTWEFKAGSGFGSGVNSPISGDREGDVSSRDRGVIFNFNPVQLIRPAERGGRRQRRRAGEGTALEGSG